MNTNIKSSNVTLTPAIHDYVNKRLKKIAKILQSDESVMCDVELAKTTEHHNKGNIFRAEIHLVGKGMNHYSSSEMDDLYAAIDMVRDEIYVKLTEGKEKRISFVRRSGARVKNMVKGLWPFGKKMDIE